MNQIFHKKQILSNFHETWYKWSSQQASQRLSRFILACKSICLQQLIKFDGKAAKKVVSFYLCNAFASQDQTLQ